MLFAGRIKDDALLLAGVDDPRWDLDRRQEGGRERRLPPRRGAADSWPVVSEPA